MAYVHGVPDVHIREKVGGVVGWRNEGGLVAHHAGRI